jgi:hypothetical protein
MHITTRNQGRTALRYALAIGLALAFSIAFAPDTHAAAYQLPDPSGFAQQAIDFLKKLWVFVIIAEVVAAITYAVAFFTQSWFPSFFQAFQGEWVKKAVIIGVAAHPVLGALFAAAEGAKGGFQ